MLGDMWDKDYFKMGGEWCISRCAERGHGLKMGEEMASNIKCYCGWSAVGNSSAKRRLVAISGREENEVRGESHTTYYDKWQCQMNVSALNSRTVILD